MKSVLFFVACLALAGCSDSRVSAVPPTPEEALQAIAAMYGGSVADMIAQQRLQLGTCIRTPAQYQPAESQYTCTFALLSPGGSSESRADFIPTKQGWSASPSMTDTELPFPDPALSLRVQTP